MSWEATGTVNRPTSSCSIDQLKADGPKLLHFIHSDKNHLERRVFLSGVLGQNQRDLDKLSLPPWPCIYQWCEKQAWDNEKWSCWRNQASLTTETAGLSSWRITLSITSCGGDFCCDTAHCLQFRMVWKTSQYTNGRDLAASVYICLIGEHQWLTR